MSRYMFFIQEYSSSIEAEAASIEHSLKGITNTIAVGNKLYLHTHKYEDSSMYFWSYEDTLKQKESGRYYLRDPRTIIVDSVDKLVYCLSQINSHDLITIDTETTGLNIYKDGLVGIGICWGIKGEESCYIPIGHWVGSNLPIKLVRQLLGRSFADTRIKKVFHNAKFDVKFLVVNGFTVSGLYFDTMIAHWLLNCSKGIPHGLKDISKLNMDCDIEVPTFKELMKEVPKKVKHKNIGDLPPERVGYYCGLDAVTTFVNYLCLQKQLDANQKIKELFFKLEMPCTSILIGMELQGLTVDIEWCKQKHIEMVNILGTLRGTAKMYKDNLNISSIQQLSKYLFEELGITTKGIPKTKAGYSLTKQVLDTLINEHPIIPLVLTYRKVKKNHSTYLLPMMNNIERSTGKLHTQYNQIGTVTGRLSSSNPNSQNFPADMRRGVIASPGHVLLSVDYSGCEYRILSSLSNCQYLIDGYTKGDDAHTSVTKMFYPGKNPKEINPATGKDYRFSGKSTNFALVYGESPEATSSRMKVKLTEVIRLRDIYWEKLPEVKELMYSTWKKVVSTGYSETVLGRRRLYELTDDFYIRQKGLPIDSIMLKENNNPNDAECFRQSFNAIIQGSNADITKLAMIAVTKIITDSSSCTKLLLQIHDELIFEIPYEELGIIIQMIVSAMENVYPFSVPLKCDYRVATDWKGCK